MLCTCLTDHIKGFAAKLLTETALFSDGNAFIEEGTPLAGVATQSTGRFSFMPSTQLTKKAYRNKCKGAMKEFLLACADALNSNPSVSKWAKAAGKAMCLPKHRSTQGASGGTATQKDVFSAIIKALIDMVSNTVNDEVNRPALLSTSLEVK